MEHEALIELMFACYKAGEIRGKRLNHTILADPNEQYRDFRLLCALEIRMANSYADLSTTGPTPPMQRIEEIQNEAKECGLIDLLWRLFEEENKSKI